MLGAVEYSLLRAIQPRSPAGYAQQLPHSASFTSNHSGMDASPSFPSPSITQQQAQAALQQYQDSRPALQNRQSSGGSNDSHSQNEHGHATYTQSVSHRQNASQGGNLPASFRHSAHQQAQSQYAAYGEDGMTDRTPGSYSPSRYAISQAQYSPAMARQQTSSGLSPAVATSSNHSSGGSPTYAFNQHSTQHASQRLSQASSSHGRSQSHGGVVRSRSAGSAFRKVRTAADLQPSSATNTHGRRADPDGGVVSVSAVYTVPPGVTV